MRVGIKLPKDIPWLRLLVEGAVIVGSILLAFGIEAWWDGAQDRVAERDILSGLLIDFQENEQQVADQLLMREWEVSIAGDLTGQLRAAPPSTELVVADSVLMSLLTSSTFDPITSTLDASVSSGQVALIRSAAVREHLADWRRVLVGLHENELAVRDIVHTLLAPELASLTRLGGAAEALARGRDAGTLPAPSSSRPLRTTPVLEGAVGLYLFNSSLVERDLRRIQEIQRALLDVLESELSR